MENIAENSDQDSRITFYQQQTTPVEEKLGGSWQLLKDAWSLYRSKFKTLIGIMIVPVVISIILNELSIISISSPALSQASWLPPIKIIIWLILLYFNAISISALLFSVKNDIGTKEAYARSFKSAFSYILVVILGTLVITGGFVLFVIPGVVFSLWFSLSVYSFVFEERKGLEALYRSKQLVEGNFWKIAWRFIFISIIAIIIAIPLAILEKVLNGSHRFVDSVGQLFLIPLVVFFGAVLFQNLVRLKQDSPFQEPGKVGKFVYYFSAFIATPLVLGFTIFQGLLFITNDIPNPNDSDLQLPAINISKGQNSFYVFMEVKDEVYWPQEEIDKNGIDYTLANKILQNNEQALDSFEKGVVLSIFQQPNLQNPKDYNANLVLGSIGFMQDLAKVNSLNAAVLFSQGKEKEAFDQSIKTIKMAQMLQDGQNGLIGYLVGLSIKETGLNNFRSLLKNSHLSSAELLYYENELNKYKESKLALQRELKGEYIMAVNSMEEINQVFRGEKPAEDSELLKGVPSIAIRSFYFYKPNKTKLLFMGIYRSLIDNVGKNNYTQINHAEKRPAPWPVLITDNAVGKILSNSIGVSLDGLFSKRFEENLSVKETQQLLALKAYKQDTGNLPDSLQTLVPNYTPELIQDPFDGKTIKYSPEKGIIYSAGKDLIDNGGNISETDWKQGDDLGFKIEF